MTSGQPEGARRLPAVITREDIRKRLKPFTREWGTVHGDIEEIIDAVMRGRQQPEDTPAEERWDRIMRGQPG